MKSSAKKKIGKRKTLIFRSKPLTRAQKLKLLKDRQKETREKRKVDPFYIHPSDIPDGRSYQWFSLTEKRAIEDAQECKWKAVPFSRHNFSRTYNSKGKIVCQNSLLMENSKAYVDSKDAENRNLVNEMLAAQQIAPGKLKFVSPSFMVSWDYKKLPADAKPVVVPVTIDFRVSVKWRDAAAALGLSDQEYARRRLLMEPHLLASYETDGKIYETVEIQIKRD